MDLSHNNTKSFILVRTKLYRPHLSNELIERPQLLTRLNHGLDKKLTLISAPAGFGKTTLASSWLKNCPLSSAWLSLNENDNDLLGFLSYLIAAIQTIFPAACPNTLSLLRPLQLPPRDYLAATVINELAELPSDFILVLDDYHLIREPAIHQLLIRLLANLPRQMHLVLTTRQDPPLPLARLRGQGQVTEIRVADLRFTSDEVQAYLTQTLGQSLPAQTMALLERETEGWIAGLHLAVLSMRSRANQMNFVETFKGRNHYVMAYLIDEVLAHQPQAIQDFLLQTSLLDRFCAPLCDAVVGRERPDDAETTERLTDQTANSHSVDRQTSFATSSSAGSSLSSQALLEWLERANFFIVPLDDHHDWYRYHHLFQGLLRHKLPARFSKEEIVSLHIKASAWLAEHGFIEEALHHILAAGDTLKAAQLVEQHRHELLNYEQWRVLERWLALLPAEIIQQRPALLLAQAWISHVQFRLLSIPPRLQKAEDLLKGQDQQEHDLEALRGEIDVLRSQIWYWQNEGQRSLISTRRALERVPPAHTYVRGIAIIYLGLAHRLLGRTDTAIRLLQEMFDYGQTQTNAFTVRLLLTLAIIYLTSGEFKQLAQTAPHFLKLATERKLPLMITWAHYLLGVLNYEWDQLDAATHHFSIVAEQRYSAHALALCNSMLGLAWTYQVQGMSAKTQETLEQLLEFVLESKNTNQLPRIHAFQARLSLLQDDLASALYWSQTVLRTSEHEPLLRFESLGLTRARILIAQGTAASLAEATFLLTHLLREAEATHLTWRIINILVLKALAFDAQDQLENALEALERAVVLAQPGNLIRTFVDLGPAMARLLHQLAEQQTLAPYSRPYIDRLLAAFPLTQRPPEPQQPDPTDLLDPLTNRELDILKLLAERLSNKEIAQTLVVSPLTVKTHTRNIYQKLGVNSRKQAVVKARTCGILSGDEN